MRSHELATGRTFGVTFDHGDDFFSALRAFCSTNGVRQGYIPMFIAGFAEAEVVGSCEKNEDSDAPVWSRVYLSGLEAMGCGTLAYDAEHDEVLPHIHATVGERRRSATGYTSHLLSAKVQFLTEMFVVEVTSPVMTRPRNADLFDVPLLTFGEDSLPGSHFK